MNAKLTPETLPRDLTLEPNQRQLEEALRDYYTRYYRTELGLPDWAPRVEARLKEEETVQPLLTKLADWLRYDFRGKRVLVVGAGTGAESFALTRLGAQVYGIEPNPEALTILKMKAHLYNLDPQAFVEATAESISFPDNCFDWVHCHTVLEHVKDVQQAIAEMVRTCKVDGYVYIQTPDYRFPNERHYKINLIPFVPKWANKAYLFSKGRPTKFWDGLNLVTPRSLDRILWKRKDVVTFRVNETMEPVWKEKTFLARFSRILLLCPQQYIFLRKVA